MERLEIVPQRDSDSGIHVKDNTNDPNQFDATMKKLLIGQGAEKYVNIFRQHNIGQMTLVSLTDADLMKLGLDDAEVRKNILNMVKDLPIYDELLSGKMKLVETHLSSKELTDILAESTEHLNRIYMSLYSVSKALSKDGVSDSLLYEDKFASDVALSTVEELASVLDTMDMALQTNMMLPTRENKQKKKMVVGAIGSAVIITLAVLFAKSLKQLY